MDFDWKVLPTEMMCDPLTTSPECGTSEVEAKESTMSNKIEQCISMADKIQVVLAAIKKKNAEFKSKTGHLMEEGELEAATTNIAEHLEWAGSVHSLLAVAESQTQQIPWRGLV
jgi:hypothetical protein